MLAQSKRRRTTYGEDETTTTSNLENSGGFEGKEEKRGGEFQSSSFPIQLQLLSSAFLPETKENERNWFCADTALAKQTCVRRRPQDIINWTTNFSSGLEGGMTAEECARTCGQPTTQFQQLIPSSSSSSLLQPPLSLSSALRSAYRIPGSENSVIVPNVNTTIINDLLASMLKSNELANLLPSSRANYVGLNAAQQNIIELETLLTGLISASKLHLNDRYYLNRIVQLLRGQGVTRGQGPMRSPIQTAYVSRFVLYPLLVEALPQLSTVNPPAFFALLDQLPHLEKLRAIFASSRRLSLKLVEQLIKQGVFQFNDDELTQKTAGTAEIAEDMELWNLRDGIFRNLVSRQILPPQIIDGFFELRHQEELRSPLRTDGDTDDRGVVLTPNLHELYKEIASSANRGVISDSFYKRLLRLFLERGYYLPLEEWDRSFETDPLYDAIDTVVTEGINDSKLIDKVASHYANPRGIARIKGMMDEIVRTSLPAAETEKERALLQYNYNTLDSILNDITTTS